MTSVGRHVVAVAVAGALVPGGGSGLVGLGAGVAHGDEEGQAALDLAGELALGVEGVLGAQELAGVDPVGLDGSGHQLLVGASGRGSSLGASGGVDPHLGGGRPAGVAGVLVTDLTGVPGADVLAELQAVLGQDVGEGAEEGEALADGGAATTVVLLASQRAVDADEERVVEGQLVVAVLLVLDDADVALQGLVEAAEDLLLDVGPGDDGAVGGLDCEGVAVSDDGGGHGILQVVGE